jgi:hypothetical protein
MLYKRRFWTPYRYIDIDTTYFSQNPKDVFTGPYGVYYREIFFHIPFLIANHLNSQQKFAEAQKWYHYLFNPTARDEESAEKPQERNWRYLEFRNNKIEPLRKQLTNKEAIATYRKNPFNPHAIARLPVRFSAYQKCIVMKYIDNLLDWGDHLFAQDTMESINEATLLYIMAADILGERPAELGECGEGDATSRTYETIARELGPDKEFLIELEHLPKNHSRSSPVPHRYILPATRVNGAAARANDHITIRRVRMLESHEPTLPEDGMYRGSDWKRQPRYEENICILPSFMGSLTKQISALHNGRSSAFCVPANDHLSSYWDRVEDRLYKIRNCMNISGVRRELSLFAPEINPMLLVRAKAAGLSVEEVLNAISGNLPPYRFAYLIERAKSYAAVLQGFGAALLSALEKKDIEELTLLRSGQQLNILNMTTQIRQSEYDAAVETLQSLDLRKKTIEYRRNYYNGLIKQGLISEERTQLDARNTAKGFEELAEIQKLVAAVGYFIPQLGSPFAITFGGIQFGNSAQAFAQILRSSAAIANTIAASAGLEAGFKRREQARNISFN